MAVTKGQSFLKLLDFTPEEIGKLILEAKPGKPQEMADRILNDAIHLLGDVKEDDMTVFVTGIWNYGTCIA